MPKIINVNEKIGETVISKQGYEMTLIKWYNAHHIIIEFNDKYKAKIKCQYNDFKNKKNIRNPYHPTICDVGFIGEGIYNKSNYPHIYEVWRGMLRRCYDNKRQIIQPTYKGCAVCEEWHNFQNFAKWYEEHYYEIEGQRMHLDKDILVKGNKIYSPQTCIIVPQTINSLFIKSDKIRGEYPIGVHLDVGDNKLIVQMNTYDASTNQRKYICLARCEINEPFKAFFIYKKEKEKEIKKIANMFKDCIPEILYNALYNYKVEIND